ncbi:MAG: sigma-70 family RNA polymerase sigma factor [Phenylobacterium sp.]|uniref:RNA polymerase sigma factor n=1 Tax=Phenylobacterium sp. TaxID=1871053 RepID=UPI00273376DE|nr:sigma-70 family RNA polymerase sigma factor [Phenylobacterium sp.]MDP3749281.1 sigma-70 family RNA polymerase sigma factor [Phenylobacterium sp.]
MQTTRGLDLSGLRKAEIDTRFRRPLMSFFLRRVDDRAEAEDLTQQVFLRLVQGAEREDVANPAAFVFRVATNLLRDRRRSSARRGEQVAIDEDFVSQFHGVCVEDSTPERVLLGRESLAEVLRTLDELGERTRDIFILFRLENMKQQDIATLYGCSRSTIEKHVMKATLHLALKHGPR